MTEQQPNRIFVEDARVISQQAYQGDQYVLRLHAPKCAGSAQPGSFAHLQCDDKLPMRRPLSIMRVDASAGWVDFLYKVVGHGTGLLAKRQCDDSISIMGPIGKPFSLSPPHTRPLLIGGGVGIPPMVFLADHLKDHKQQYHPFALMGSEVPFPFQASPSQMLVPGMPDGVIASMPLLEDWGIPGRLTSLQGYPGCHQGYVTDLARLWLEALDDAQRTEVIIYSCGPRPMLQAVAKLAREYRLACQVSLEEFMACGVGGCAGCAVRVHTADGVAMKRVCVDGPVFDAATVFSD
ncbi:MAG: dihydroorotate dehydrogenase electron transfer subunit [Gammaproteobacteria bacterium]|nr:MAG: dihydroorotate dehydrogenase electron transfer subunit [Gammaproteobacteria bacterium]